MMGKPALTIVAAALQISVPNPATGKDQLLIISAPPPARHHTLLHPMGGRVGFIGPDEQGFLASDGRFYGRIGAAQIALTAGQITELKFNPYDLFSEDLW